MPTTASAAPGWPPGPLPPPLRGTDDAAARGFTFDSIHRRLPLILDETLAHNGAGLPPATVVALRELRQEIVADAPLRRVAPGQPEPAWEAYADAHAGADTWLSAPWFYVENLLYKLILDAVRAGGGPADPFAHQKSASLAGARAPFLASVLPLVVTAGGGSASAGDPAAWLLRSLWGNRADLSLHTVAALAAAHHGGGGGGDGGGASAAAAAEEDGSLLLADDTDAVVAHLRQRAAAAAAAPPQPGDATHTSPLPRVCFLLDNCGLELLADLALADRLLATGLAPGGVTLWAKAAPVFVSDALPGDVTGHVDWIASLAAAASGEHAAAGASELAARLRAALADGRLAVRSHAFFTSPLPMWDAPADLVDALRGADLVIAKGDGE
jgi:hypothetical protein